MHMADALLSPAVGGALWAASGTLLAVSARKVRLELEEKRIPLMGMAGAFVFAAQMINFAIPMTGSSGHISGAVLLAALLGAAPAFIVMAGVLLVQALFFADGGILALGCNLFNMGFFGCFIGYLCIFRPIAGDMSSRWRVFAGALLGCTAALECGAFAVTLETLLSGITELPFGVFAGTMLAIHLPIGLCEGAATGAVLLFIRRSTVDLENILPGGNEPLRVRLSLMLGAAALLCGGVLSLAASEKPDGLEWSVGRIAGEIGVKSVSVLHRISAAVAEAAALLPDYSFRSGESAAGTSLAGITGTVICAVVLVMTAGIICRKKRKNTL